MLKILITIILVSLSGCSAIQTAVGKASSLNDEALKSSEFTICRGASVGSVLRRYNTKELADAWVRLCINNTENPIVTEITNRD